MILDKIVAHKKKEIASLKAGSAPIRKAGRFYRALKDARGIAVIAEIKRKSPSKGILRKNFKPTEIAGQFGRSGASALSVLTDRKFFGGSGAILKQVRRSTKLPLLRKDFIISEAQIPESVAMGADAILLIAAILSRKKMAELAALASRAGLDVLFEAHTASELKKILAVKPKIVGINNRDLRTFRVDLKTTEKLAPKIPKGVLLVSESGIRDAADLARLKKSGVKAVLVGESLMKEKDPGAALKKILGVSHGPR